MDREARKAAQAAWRERKAVAGVYALCCLASGEVWTGRTPDLEKIENRLWFSLRQGTGAHPAVQAAWRRHGAAAFAFEVVERLDPETPADLRDHRLKARLAYWTAELQARAI